MRLSSLSVFICLFLFICIFSSSIVAYPAQLPPQQFPADIIRQDETDDPLPTGLPSEVGEVTPNPSVSLLPTVSIVPEPIISVSPSSAPSSTPPEAPSESPLTPIPSIIPSSPIAASTSFTPTASSDPIDSPQDVIPLIPSESASASPVASVSSNTENSPSPLDPSQNNSTNGNPGEQSPASIPTAVLIPVSVAAAVAVILALALIVYVVQRMRPSRQNDSYYQFSTDDNPGGGASTATIGAAGVSSQGGPSSSTITPGLSGSTGPGNISHLPSSHPPPTANNASIPVDARAGGIPLVSVAATGATLIPDLSSGPPGPANPSAPSPSQFSRRDSDASSASSDTIVAPIYANDSVSTTVAAPWFTVNRSELPPSH